MKRLVRRVSFSYVGYLFTLLVFVFLGLFVAALAVSASTIVVVPLAIAIGLSVLAAIAGFRLQLRLGGERSHEPGFAVSGEILSPAEERARRARYLENYRA